MENMYQLKFQNIATITQTHPHIIKLTQLFISLSLFSFIFSPSSLYVLLHYFKFSFSTFPFQLYTHNIDKNSMFLLCNGLLVFVRLTKSFSNSSSDNVKKPDDLSSDLPSSSQYIEQEEEGEENCSQSHVSIEVNESKLNSTSEPNEQHVETEEEEEDEVVEENIENMIFIDEDKGEEMNELEEVEQFDINDEENDYIVIEENNNIEEEEEENNIEELNKKCEEFIRKMKEDIRIEARRHLIMV